jgi:hypothetical protein
MTEGIEQSRPEHKYIVRIGDGEEYYTSREEALAYAKEQSRDVRGPVIVDSEKERSSYRYIGGELAQFVMETRR